MSTRPPPLPHRRKAGRFPSTSKVLVESPVRAEGVIRDISLVGLKVDLVRACYIEVGTVLVVRFQVPTTGAMVSTQVEVARRETPHIYGVKFLRVCKDVLDGIQAHLVGHR